MIEQESPKSTRGTTPCPKCEAKGVIEGTRGFITCPKCQGTKAVDPDRLRTNYRLDSQRMVGNPAVWQFIIPPAS